MATCDQCKAVISEDCEGNILKCDICLLNYCSSCFSISPTEVRVIPLKKRVLCICCTSCKPIATQCLAMRDKIKHLEEEIRLLKNCIDDKNIIIADKTQIITLMQENQNKKSGNLHQPITYDKDKNISNETRENMITLSQVSKAVDSALGNSNKPSQRVTSKPANTSNTIPTSTSIRNSNELDFMGTARETSTSIRKVKTTDNNQREIANCGQFLGVPMKKWFHVSRAKHSTTSNTVLEYIKKKINIKTNEEIAVTKLKTSGDTASFKVGIDLKYQQQMISDGFWPENIVCRNFIFNKINNREYRRNYHIKRQHQPFSNKQLPNEEQNTNFQFNNSDMRGS